MKKKIIITGKKIHEVGYRPFLLAAAENLKIKKFFADNIFINGRQAVYILLDTQENKIKAFVEQISQNKPQKAEIENIAQEDYSGNVMSIESYYRYLTASQLSKIGGYGGSMLEKQDSMLGKTDLMLSKQDSMLLKLDEHMAITKEILLKQDDMKATVQDGFISLKASVDHGFDELKQEHIKTREMSHEIFYAEVQALRHELGELRTMVEEIKKKVGIA